MARERLHLHALAFGVAAALAGAAGNVWAQEACGDITAGLQVDYRNPAQASLLHNINTNHFNDDVANLRKGQSGSIASDLDYILRNAPNHTQALYVMSKYHLQQHTEKFRDESFSMTCWFDRAMRFAPTDAAVRLVYAIYLHQKGERAAAEQRYLEAIALNGNFAEAHYNLGLLYVDMGRYGDALKQARDAYRLGYPLPGLKQKLVAANQWVDAESVAAPP